MTLIRLEATPFVSLVGDIIRDRSSGVLTVLRGSHRRVFYWAYGELALCVPDEASDQFAGFLVKKGVLTPEEVAGLAEAPPLDVVTQFQESRVLDSMKRQALLREWLRGLFVPLFSLEDGTAAFHDEEALAPERRVLLQSSAPLVLDGIRAMSNGLLIRHALGDLKRVVGSDPDATHHVDALSLTDSERRIAESLDAPTTLEAFLKRFPNESLIAAKVVIALTALGSVHDIKEQVDTISVIEDDPQRDLELISAIGAGNPKALRAVGLARMLPKLDLYSFLDVPRRATSNQIAERCERMRREYAPTEFPAVIQKEIEAIRKMVERAQSTLTNAVLRHEYDRGMTMGKSDQRSLDQANARRQGARQNLEKGRELSIRGDYHSAIVLLKQAVVFEPGNAEAWLILGQCQQKNPRWRRLAAESYHKSLAADPNSIETMISLGDLYRAEGLASRAQSFYEDVLKIDETHEIAKKRLKSLL